MNENDDRSKQDGDHLLGVGHDLGQDHAQALRGLTDLARQELPPQAFAHESAAAYQHFVQRNPRRRERSGLTLRWLGVRVTAGVALSVALGVALGTWRVMLPAPLSVIVAGGAVEEGGFVRSGPSDEPSLRFSDGTEVKLGPRSRARVAQTTRRGARVLLEEGRAQARVVAHKGAQWVFDAGPCRIHVTGTRFDMHWSAQEQLLEVRLYSGGVTVMGPPSVAGVPMRAGQRLVMDVRQGSVRLTDLAADVLATRDSGSVPGPGESPSAPTEDVGPTAGSPAKEVPATAAPKTPVSATVNSTTSAGVGARRGESWPARVLAGEFRTVIDEGERRGIEDVLRVESAANIMALADAARYAGAAPLAEKVLLKVRARFPQTPPAYKAAFLLGRIAEDQQGNLGSALRWYETYLTDAPDDAFRAEAMGRRMTATLHLSGPTRARDYAADYLRRYPQGAYAQAARAILSR